MSKKDKVKNKAQIVKGKIKEATGKSSGDTQMEADGDLDQVKGHMKEAGEKVKDALES
jgi:uncharacterized protein YjbJ (UPF0337 family)